MHNVTTLSHRITLLKRATFIALSVITCRLVYLQITRADHLFTLSQKNFLRTATIDSQRGNIVDQTGNLIATNRPVSNLYWRGTGHATLTTQHQEALAVLAASLGTLVQEKLNDIEYAERRAQRLLLATDLSHEQLSPIMEQLYNHPNIFIDTTIQRFYPHNSIACHVLGYLGNVNVQPIGQMGLEKLLENQLHGQEGLLLRTVDSKGKKLHEEELQHALHGANIHTTLDLPLQKIIETIFPGNYTGCFIAMDPYNGAIKALVSRPNFDPNMFLGKIPYNTWQLLQEKKPFINRALISFPPASIFKLVTIAAALEENIIEHNGTIDCRGFITFGNQVAHCSRRYGHGTLTVKQALAQSCNILFFEIAKQIHIDTLADYAHRFGLGIKTDFLLPDDTGLIPTTAWKQQSKGEQWWPGETLSVAIGQSYLLASPLQIARMVASIFTGYLVNPRLLSNEPIITTPLALKQSTLNFLQHSMKSVVTKGTGKKVSKIQDITIYAKTGTAQTCSFKRRYDNPNNKEHAWFVATFWYKDYDPLTIVILIEHAGSGQVATTIAKNFLMHYRKHHK